MQARNASLSDRQEIRIPSRLPPWFVWTVVAICVAPLVLNLGGIDFGSTARSFPYAEAASSISIFPAGSEGTGDRIEAELPGEFLDPMFYRLSGAFTHTILEWSAFCTAIFAVLLAFATLRVTRSVVIPLIAAPLLFAGVMDAFHTLAADRLIEAVTDNRDLIPFTWAICRFFKALIPVLGIVIVIARPIRRPRTDIAILLITSAGFLCLAYVIIHVCATSDRLPPMMFPQALFTRPWDLIPLVVYVLSGLFVYPRFHRANPSIFSHALLVSVIPDSATQVYMAFGSTALFDNHFNIAHFLKIFAYFVPVAGLVLDYVRTHEVQGRILEALRSSEERTRSIVDHVVDGIITIDERGHVERMNPAAERIFGYRSDELLGKTVGRLMPVSYWSEYQAQIQGFLVSGEAELIGVGREVEGLHKNGTVLPMELTVSAGIIDGRNVFTGVVRDTTERRHLEEERRGRELEARLVHQATSMAADTDSFEGALQHCIDTVCELTGWPVGHVYFPADGEPDLLKPSEIWHIDRSLELTRFVDATEQTDFRRGIGLPGRILASGSPAWIENVHTDPNFPRAGLFEGVEVRGAFGFPIHVAGEIVAVLEFFSPKEVKEDARLLHIVASVGAQVGRVLERQHTNERLREAMLAAKTASRVKSEFLANMSHELRTPLNSVIGFSSLLLRGEKSRLDAKDRSYIDRILQNGKHLLNLINEVLDISKIEAGRIDLDPQPLALEEVIQDVVRQHEAAAKESQLEVTAEVPPDLTTLNADETRLKQILINLVGNALKFTEKGGVTIRVVATPGTHRPELIEVIDTGIGIASERLGMIFEAFEQADSTTARRYGGTGLGLAISRSLCRLMGFELQVQSQVGEGSNFRIVLAPAAVVEATVKEPQHDRVGL